MKFALTTADLMCCWSVGRFIDNLIESLVQRRSLLVLLPDGIDAAEIWNCVWSTLWKREFHAQTLYLSEYPDRLTPASIIAQHLRLPYSDKINTLTEYEWPTNLPEIIQIEDYGAISPIQRAVWLNFLAEWARESHAQANQGLLLPSLCLISSAATLCAPPPPTDVRLAVHTWTGLPSTLEMRLLCRAQHETESLNLSSTWREHLLPTLAGNDIAVINYLWNDIFENADVVAEMLCRYAEERNWTASKLREWGGNMLLRISTHIDDPERLPQSEYLALWKYGALCWTPEHGLELHSAALALLGDSNALRRRLWREQVALLLPVLDSIRLAICQHLIDKYKPDWPHRLALPTEKANPAAIPTDPLMCEFGYLVYMLYDCAALRSEGSWKTLVTQARKLRNDLAHYKPVEYQDVKILLSEAARTGLNITLPT